jgi:hypothetical protein
MQWVFLALVLTGITVVVVRTQLERRDNVPLRQEAERQEITFRLRLDRVRVFEKWGAADAKGSGMALIVRTDTFEVTATTPLFRSVFGMEYHFRARDTTIEMGELPKLALFDGKKTWILIRGQPGGGITGLAIASKDYQYDAWVALVRAGAVPIGPPPAIPPSGRSASGSANPGSSDWLPGFQA